MHQVVRLRRTLYKNDVRAHFRNLLISKGFPGSLEKMYGQDVLGCGPLVMLDSFFYALGLPSA